MGQRHRLRTLQVRIAGDEDAAVGFRHGKRGPAGVAQLGLQDCTGVLQEQPHVGRNLVVAASRSVQFGRGRHAPGECVLEVHVHILQPRVPPEPAGFDLAREVVQPGTNGIAFLAGAQPDVGKHRRVRLAPLDIERREAPIKGYRLTEFQHQSGRLR